MKTIAILSVSALLYLALPSYGQKKEDQIRQIRKDFQAINSNTTLRVISLDAEAFLENLPDGGAKLTGYYEKDKLVKIVEWIGLSYGNRIREFYFKNEKMFFVYEKFQSFVQKGEELDKSKTRTSFEGRYYIVRDKVIEQKIIGERTLEEEPENILKEFETAAVKYRRKLLRND